MVATLNQDLTFQQEMSGLKKELKRRGYYRKQPVRMVAQRLAFLSIQLLGIVGYWSVGDLGLRAGAIVLTAVGILGAAAQTHTASHQGLFGSRWLNNGLVFLGYPFGIGLSATYWWHKHVVVHHPNPNIHGVDEDIDFMPYFVLTQEDLNRKSAFGRLWYRWQGLIFPVFLSLNVVSMQLSGWKQLIGTLTDKSARKPAHWLDLSFLLAHYGSFVVVPSFFLPVGDVLVFYLLWLVLSGYGAFALLAPGHLPAEAGIFTPQALAKNVYLRQLATTVNFRAGWLGTWLCCGLDYQIEHHLFPGVSHQFYPAISALLRPICQRHGYPHQTLGWGEALRKSYQSMRCPKPVHNVWEVVKSPP